MNLKMLYRYVQVKTGYREVRSHMDRYGRSDVDATNMSMSSRYGDEDDRRICLI